MGRRINKESVMKIVFFIAALASIAAVLLICVFLFANGIPAVKEIGLKEFLLGLEWKPNDSIPKYGIFPMIVGSIYVTVGALIVGVPIGLFTAVFMARFCPRKIYKPLKTAIDLLAGIPSVVFGFFGLVIIVPFIRDNFDGKIVGKGTHGELIKTCDVYMQIANSQLSKEEIKEVSNE